jgi:hypothetical protein
MSSIRPAIVAITSGKIDSSILSQLNQFVAKFPTALPTSIPDLTVLWKDICQAFLQTFEEYQTKLLTQAEAILGRLGVVPEQRIFIYYYSFDPIVSVEVSIPGFTFPSRLIKSHSLVLSSPQKDILPNIYEIQAIVPSMDVLQDTQNYRSKRNGVLMWLPLQVYAFITDTTKSLETLPSGFAVWLPQPIVGIHSLDKGTVRIGTFLSKNNGDDKTNFFGTLAGRSNNDPNGQVRWYSFSLWQAIQIGDLMKYSFLPVDDKIDLVNNVCFAHLNLYFHPSSSRPGRKRATAII